MLDIDTRQTLKFIEDIMNDAIDKFIQKRNSNPRAYRYIIKKLEHGLGMVHKAEEIASDE